MDKRSKQWQKRFETVWDPEGAGQYRLGSCGLRMIRQFRLLANPSGTINDYGSGTGRAAVRMVEEGLQVNCVDIATNAMEEEARALIGRGITFFHASLWELPEDFPKVKHGFCADVLMTLPEDRVDEALANIARTCEELFVEVHPWQDVRCGMELTQTSGDADFWEEKLSILT